MKRLLLVFLLSTSSVRAEFLSGNELYAHLTSSESLDRIFGMGYVAGVYDTGLSVLHCPTSNSITLKQAVDITKNYLSRHPEIREKSADVLINAALARVWPCATKGRGT